MNIYYYNYTRVNREDGKTSVSLKPMLNDNLAPVDDLVAYRIDQHLKKKYDLESYKTYIFNVEAVYDEDKQKYISIRSFLIDIYDSEECLVAEEIRKEVEKGITLDTMNNKAKSMLLTDNGIDSDVIHVAINEQGNEFMALGQVNAKAYTFDTKSLAEFLGFMEYCRLISCIPYDADVSKTKLSDMYVDLLISEHDLKDYAYMNKFNDTKWYFNIPEFTDMNRLYLYYVASLKLNKLQHSETYQPIDFFARHFTSKDIYATAILDFTSETNLVYGFTAYEIEVESLPLDCSIERIKAIIEDDYYLIDLKNFKTIKVNLVINPYNGRARVIEVLPLV